MTHNAMTQPGNGVLVALSGGADSTALLRVLLELKSELGIHVEAAHVHHGIRGVEADRDETFCRALCERLDVPFHGYHCDVPAYAKEQGISMELAARQLRYQGLEDMRTQQNLQYIATAHHQEDNAETLLFRLARGTGLVGLGGIPPVRGKIIRPLLDVGREEIEAYLQQLGQEFVTDSTNGDVRYSRNRIRSRVLPELEQVSHGAAAAMCRLAEDARQEEQLLSQLAADLWEPVAVCSQERIALPAAVIAQAHPALASRALRQMFHHLSGQELERDHTHALLQLVQNGHSGNRLDLPQGWQGKLDVDQLVISRSHGPKEGYCIPVEHLPAQVDIPDEKMTVHFLFSPHMVKKIQRKLVTIPLDYDTIKNNLVVRNRRPGDRLRPCGFDGTRRLKKMMAEARIPLEMRDRLPLIVCSGVVVACPGLRPDATYMAHPDTRQVIYVVVEEREEEGKDKNHASGSGSHPFDRGTAKREGTGTGSTDLPRL